MLNNTQFYRYTSQTSGKRLQLSRLENSIILIENLNLSEWSSQSSRNIQLSEKSQKWKMKVIYQENLLILNFPGRQLLFARMFNIPREQWYTNRNKQMSIFQVKHSIFLEDTLYFPGGFYRQKNWIIGRKSNLKISKHILPGRKNISGRKVQSLG